MEITDVRTAREFIAAWHTAKVQGLPGGYLDPGRQIRGAADGLTRSLSIMDAAPGRYTEHQRASVREAIHELRHGFHPYATPTPAPTA